MSAHVTLRPARDTDREFLFNVYAATRKPDLQPAQWDEERKEWFLRMQFKAQDRLYHEQFPEADYQVILEGKRRIGRLYVDRRKDEIRIMDLSLLPERRNSGIGSALLKEILEESNRTGKPTRIHVDKRNPALGFVRRLGFSPLKDSDEYWLLEKKPAVEKAHSAR